jgi:hypothetical protein
MGRDSIAALGCGEQVNVSLEESGTKISTLFTHTGSCTKDEYLVG